MLFHYHVVESKFCNYTYYEMITPEEIKNNHLEHILIFTSHKNNSSISFINKTDTMFNYDVDETDTINDLTDIELCNLESNVSVRNFINYIKPLHIVKSLVVIPYNLSTYMACMTLINDIGNNNINTFIYDEDGTIVDMKEWGDKMKSSHINIISNIPLTS